jgi:ankyrin repeat protein
MTFLQHLQSSLILGTKMAHPEEEHFLKQDCKELITAIDKDSADTLRLLIEAGLDPDKCEQRHITALCYAVKYEKIEALQCLLSYGCDVNHIDGFNRRALDYAYESKNEKTIELLLRYGAFSQNTQLPSNRLSFDVSNIFEAALLGNLHALVYYYNLGTHVHHFPPNKRTLLHLCIEGNNPKLLIYLLNKGISIDEADQSGNSALIMAAMEPSRLKLLEILISRNATLDQRNHRHTSALTMAIKRFNIQAVRLLIKAGANVNIRDGIETPLSLTHKALDRVVDKRLQKELRDLETLLMSKGAHVNNNHDKLRWSPLMQTASHYPDEKSIAHLKLLIKLGAKIDQTDKNKRTALMIASSLGRIEALGILVKQGAQMNIFDKFGWTALMLAVYYNQKEIVKFLLQAGADVNISAKKGLSAMKIAIDNERVSLIPILKNYGAVSPNE